MPVYSDTYNTVAEEDLEKKESPTEQMSFEELPPIPEDQDFIEIPFRVLSGAMIAAHTWRATDFSQENVLENSVAKLIGKPVKINHNLYTGIEKIGYVLSTEYVPAMVSSEGEVIPAGINAIFKIDAKAYPKIARQLLAQPSDSASVTVIYKWKPSHDEDNFKRSYIGDIADDGRMIARQVVEILDYLEVSIVFRGADPYAKKLNEEGIPQQVDKTLVFNPIQGQAPNTRTADAEQELELAQQSFSAETKNEETETKESLSKEHQKVIDSLTQQFACGVEELPQKIRAFKWVEKGSLEALKLINIDLKAEAKATMEQLAVAQEKLETFLQTKREECKRLYALQKSGELSQEMMTLIDKADEPTLETLLKEVGASLTESFNVKCPCGKDVAIRASLEEEGGSSSNQNTPTANPYEKYYKSNRKFIRTKK